MIKELRIGNLVFDKNGNIKSVCSILNNTLMLEDNQYIGTPIEWCNPIPLTEDWLLKFGFEKDNDSEFSLENHRYILVKTIHYEGFLLCDGINGLRHVKTVHQLQNLYFALTNEELTFKS